MSHRGVTVGWPSTGRLPRGGSLVGGWSAGCILGAWFVVAGLSIGGALGGWPREARAQAAEPPTRAPSPAARRVVQLDGGTLVGDQAQPRWNRVVLLARPRIASGDTQAVASMISQAVDRFVLTVLATVEAVPSENADGSFSEERRFRLGEVGAGYSVQRGEELLVVRVDGNEAQGVKLSFVERQVLAEYERQLRSIRTVVVAGTLQMFDVPAVLLRGERHESLLMRHMIWVDSSNGRLATMVWLLEEGSDDELRVVDSEPLRWLDNQGIEDRKIHVDGREFTLGIPGQRAFAMQKMPPGREIPWKDEVRRVAALRQYDVQSLQALVSALSQANRKSLAQAESNQH